MILVADIVCEDCGKPWSCRYIHIDDDCPAGEHETAARVQGWTVWRENGGRNRQTILCPKHRQRRGIPPRVTPLN